MGIRIRKILGYAIEVEIDEDGELVDDRFNPKGYFFWDDYKNKQEIVCNFPKFIEENIDELSDGLFLGKIDFEIYLRDKENISGLIECDFEYGSNIIIFRPPATNDWMRYDNIIDYVEDSGNGCEPKVNWLNQSIYPYESYVNLKTKKRNFKVKNKDGEEFIVPYRSIYSDLGMTDCRTFLSDMEFDSIEEARDNIVPIVPEMIHLYCKYLNIFKDPDEVYKLKPCIYTYWA